MNNGNGTLCCTMNSECCLCNHLVSVLMHGNETLCSRTGMCFSVEGILWPDRHACTQSGSDLAIVPILKVY